jgi:hypothetical protein
MFLQAMRLFFVKQQLELNAANSNFYLRNDAQLLQGATTASTNSGVGNLSVFKKVLQQFSI